jgi:hypothetical protein
MSSMNNPRIDSLVNGHEQIVHKTVEDYENYGKMEAIKKRLKDLTNPEEVLMSEDMKIAMQGLNKFFAILFTDIPHPVIPMTEVREFIEGIFLSVFNVDGSDQAPLIFDPILQRLIIAMGDNFNDERILNLILIAKGDVRSPITKDLAREIFLYIQSWVINPGSNVASRQLGSILNIEILEKEDSEDKRTLQILKKLQAMSVRYGNKT